MPFITVDDHTLVFQLRRSQRVKRLQMMERDQRFEVVAPKRISNREILAFIWQHRRWMLRHARKRARQKESIAWPEEFLAGEKITFQGQVFTLDVKFGQKALTQMQQTLLQVRLGSQTQIHGIAEEVKRQVMTWFANQTLNKIQQYVDRYSPLIGQWPKACRLKQQKTRWGSCGISKVININWLLILAPPGVLEYVVVHELCHLIHRNHGKRFWAKVEKCFPEYHQYESWLSQNGHTLQAVPVRGNFIF